MAQGCTQQQPQGALHHPHKADLLHHVGYNSRLARALEHIYSCTAAAAAATSAAAAALQPCDGTQLPAPSPPVACTLEVEVEVQDATVVGALEATPATQTHILVVSVCRVVWEALPLYAFSGRSLHAGFFLQLAMASAAHACVAQPDG